LNENSTIVLIIAAGHRADKIIKIVAAHSTFEVLDTLEQDDKLVERVTSLNPAVVIIDIELLGKDWASVVYEIKDSDRGIGVIVIVPTRKKADLLAVFREGADALLSGEFEPDDLIPALETVIGGRIYYRKSDAEVIREHMLYLELGTARNVADVKDGIAKLTVREKEVFPLLADGRSIKEVARTLGISPKTVETHKYHIMEKLNLQRMADLTKLAIIKDLIPL